MKWLERAKLWGPRRIEKNKFEKELREKRSKEPILNVKFDEDVLKNLWNNDKYSLKEYVGKNSNRMKILKKLKKT